MARFWLLILVLPGLAMGCAHGETNPPLHSMAVSSFPEGSSPAAPGSSLPHLFTSSDGTVLMSWVEPAGTDTVALRFARLTDDGWSAPGTIAQGNDWFVNWADVPSLIQLEDGTLAAHFLAKSSGGPYAYDVRITQSFDGGATWNTPVTPHHDGTATEHGFVSLLPAPDGRLFAAWLDGRHTGGIHKGHGGAMTMRAAHLDATGATADDLVLDARVCDCCPTSAARLPDGYIVAYRDRTEDERRDISTIRYQQGIWSTPAPVHEDRWHIEGCPVNGPAVAADETRVAVAWFTGADETPRVYVAFSDDAGAHFNSPIRIDDGTPIGRVDVLLLPDGSALVSWVERTDGAAEIRLRHIAADGSPISVLTIAATSPERASGFPRMARYKDGAVLAWTETGEPSTLHTVLIHGAIQKNDS